ncbi:MAG: IMPACT family protein [Myxococcales bacterium]|jgi:uncharacterized YigZ family protein
MLTLTGPCSHELEIKKSRFVALAAPVATAEAALEFIERNGDPAASHNCWAYKIGQEYRFYDDGEPKGTAGKPILAAIERHGLDAVAVLVTRFFGGIKLGTGGLARAYGGAAAECLRLAGKREIKPMVRARLKVPFELIGMLHPVFDRHGARKQGESFTGEGAVLVVEVASDALHTLRDELRDLSAGRLVLEREAP